MHIHGSVIFQGQRSQGQEHRKMGDAMCKLVLPDSYVEECQFLCVLFSFLEFHCNIWCQKLDKLREGE